MSRRVQARDVAHLGIGAGAAMFLCCLVAPTLVVWAAVRLLRRITVNRKEAR